MRRTPNHRPLSKLAAMALGTALVLTACAPASEPADVPLGEGGNFTVAVVDQLNDVGRGPSLALDQDGDPVVSYILTKQVPKPGIIPAPIIAGLPQPPAVLLATLSEGVWSRQSVTAQSKAPAVGEAKELADEKGYALPGVSTGLAIDSQDTKHVIWSTPSGLFYSSASGEAFGEPEKIANGSAVGGSIAAGSTGTVWISFYGENGVHVASGTGDSWNVQSVDPKAAAPSDGTATTSIRVGGGGAPIVAYGADGRTFVASSRDGGWNVDAVPGPGGYGVSLAVDADGNPHVAYYDADGGVHHAHSIDGGTWEVTDIAGPGAAPAVSPGGEKPALATSIAVSEDGTHFVAWTDPASTQVLLASNQTGDFAPRSLPGSAGGVTPSIAVSPDGRAVVVAWYDSVNTNMDVATPASTELALAYSPSAAPVASPTQPTAQCDPSGNTVEISAEALAFDTDCLAVVAGRPFKIIFNNADPDVPHNVSVYTDSSAQEHIAGADGPADIVVGPTTTTYQNDPLEAGNYYFQCDVHTNMNGTFVVAEASRGQG